MLDLTCEENVIGLFFSLEVIRHKRRVSWTTQQTSLVSNRGLVLTNTAQD